MPLCCSANSNGNGNGNANAKWPLLLAKISVRAQSGGKASDASALKRNYRALSFQHSTLDTPWCFRMTNVVSTFQPVPGPSSIYIYFLSTFSLPWELLSAVSCSPPSGFIMQMACRLHKILTSYKSILLFTEYVICGHNGWSWFSRDQMPASLMVTTKMLLYPHPSCICQQSLAATNKSKIEYTEKSNSSNSLYTYTRQGKATA